MSMGRGSHVVRGLKHDTHYQFRAVLGNAAGTSYYTDETNTTIGK